MPPIDQVPIKYCNTLILMKSEKKFLCFRKIKTLIKRIFKMILNQRNLKTLLKIKQIFINSNQIPTDNLIVIIILEIKL
jgi:hypothetical protein